MNKVIIVSFHKRFKTLEQKIQKVIRQSLIEISKYPLHKQSEARRVDRDVRLEVYLIDNKTMNALGRRFNHRDKPSANILSFPVNDAFPYPDFSQHFLGEIYLAPDYIKVQGQNIDSLAIHGLLHLLGYTHNKKRDRMEMETLEKKIVHKT